MSDKRTKNFLLKMAQETKLSASRTVNEIILDGVTISQQTKLFAIEYALHNIIEALQLLSIKFDGIEELVYDINMAAKLSDTERLKKLTDEFILVRMHQNEEEQKGSTGESAS